MKQLILIIISTFIFSLGYSQVKIMTPIESVRNKKIDYEYGYLPGKRFPYYKTIEKYDFNGQKIRVELYDYREIKGLQHIDCSTERIENLSEFAKENSILRVAQYIDKLFQESNIQIDTTVQNSIEIYLEALDSRLIGFGYIKIHGLCQIRVKYLDNDKIYCSDIMDGDKNSPLGKYAFVTRKTGLRKMGSASIREVIEQFLADLKNDI
ncbi:hypothetical protein SDC9_33425 [bioreactor metagenome]|uniref:Uncharacterized protein n=1 Tax=bioreactor metagenome TaxID=1076179 RepID=A0A644V8Q6_9ZZZZ|nr:hypothetical protein [Lentimicrobium sp.]MEA5110887.1 hypothetical protein [Lentimicrobium sp.]